MHRKLGTQERPEDQGSLLLDIPLPGHSTKSFSTKSRPIFLYAILNACNHFCDCNHHFLGQRTSVQLNRLSLKKTLDKATGSEGETLRVCGM